MTRRFPAALVIVAILVPGTLTAGSAPAGTIRIGILAPLSGPYASGGSSFLQAATLAVESANASGGVLGMRVELAVSDTQGKVEVAKAEALRLVHREKVFALVGAYLSEETVGAIETAASARRVIIVPVAATAEITDLVARDHRKYRYVFRVGYSIRQWAGMMAGFVKRQEVKTYAFVGAAIRWNRELAGALKEALAPAGIIPVYEAFYSPGNPAFEPIAVAALSRSPGLLVLGDPGRNSVTFVKRIREGSGAFPILSVGGTLGDARVAVSLPLSAPLYVQAAAWKGGSEAATRYAEAFEKRYGYPPSGYSDTLPHDAVTVLLEAIRQARKADSEAVIAALERGAFPATAGTYRFDARHQAAWGATGPSGLHGTVIRWEKDGARIVFPAP